MASGTRMFIFAGFVLSIYGLLANSQTHPDNFLQLLSPMSELAEMKNTSPTNSNSSAPNIDFSEIALAALSVASGLITVISFLDRVLIPQPTTAEDTLRIVEKLADSLLLENIKDKLRVRKWNFSNFGG